MHGLSLSPQTATFPNFTSILWNRQREVVATDENLKNMQLAEASLLALAIARPIPDAVLAIREETGWDDKGCTHASYHYYQLANAGKPALARLHSTNLVRRDIIGTRIIWIMVIVMSLMIGISFLSRWLG
jgi:hypothetical protein